MPIMHNFCQSDSTVDPQNSSFALYNNSAHKGTQFLADYTNAKRRTRYFDQELWVTLSGFS